MGNITEVLTMQKPCRGSPCKKISKDQYVDTRNGEVYDYQHIENRAGSLESIRQTFCKIRALINTNVVDASCCLWHTFTYADNMCDPERLYKDFEKFWKKFCRWCEKEEYSKPEYISVVEPQGRGAWHVHAFSIWPSKAPFIPNNEVIQRLWGQGFTKTKAVEDCDNIGAYFSAYLGDMPFDEVCQLPADERSKALAVSSEIEKKQFFDEQGFKKEKKFVKGGRLSLYPPGMNILRSSRGIKKPEVEYMTEKKAKEKVSAATETFSRTLEILDNDGMVVNVISKSYYNSKRKK